MPRAVKHRLDEPGQIIPQHGCVPALPASVSPGSGNFSRNINEGCQGSSEPSVCHRSQGLEVKLQFSTSGRGRNIFLTFPFIDQDFSPIDIRGFSPLSTRAILWPDDSSSQATRVVGGGTCSPGERHGIEIMAPHPGCAGVRCCSGIHQRLLVV
jgi:hypothetical protein